jgi:drug/metabolite transporter (DMT)-like permease
MIKRLTIGFLFTTLLLVVSEYVFLREVFSGKRTVVIAAGLVGIAIASFFFLRFFVRYHKVLKDS